jgi:c(7)-type cytochrome triheme protein
VRAPFAGVLRVPYPPYAIERDFNVPFGHKTHAPVACTACHPNSSSAPHARCGAGQSGCHSIGPRPTGPSARCEQCHIPAIGKPQPAELAALHDTVDVTFSHPKHAKRSRLGGDCTTCHAAIRTTDAMELPRPTARECATGGCHDGKAAFPVTDACSRCHTQTPERYTVVRPTARFTHGGSHAAAMDQPCASCHPVINGEVARAGHAACAGCHSADFGAREPTICGACHLATEPWRHLVADALPTSTTEFGAMMDHADHAQPCRSCHVLRTESAQLRPPRGHGACTGNGCHALAAGPAPHLPDCTACHSLGLVAARLAARANDPWSTRAAFDHDAHARDASGAELACTSCHVALVGGLVALPTPAKPTCAPCHDGTRAFSLTGTSCTRCHASEGMKQ